MKAYAGVEVNLHPFKACTEIYVSDHVNILLVLNEPE
jgi:hypothetical protein